MNADDGLCGKGLGGLVGIVIAVALSLLGPAVDVSPLEGL